MKRMGLLEKSKENLEIIDICLKNGHYNAGINRAYYAAFQKIKDYLQDAGYKDEEQFDQLGNPYRTFAHGSIANVLISHLREKYNVHFLKLVDLQCYDDLYRDRRLADYHNRMMSEIDLKDRKKQVIAICNLVDSAKEGLL